MYALEETVFCPLEIATLSGSDVQRGQSDDRAAKRIWPERVSPVQGAPPGLRAEPSRRAAPIIRATVGVSIYISTNYFVGWVEVSKTPRGPASFGVHSRGNGPFSAGFRNTIEDPRSKAAKVTCFTVHFGTGFRGGPDPATLSRIRPCRALWPANGATRRKSRRGNTVLPDRRLRRSRARGADRFRTRHPSRGSGASARGLRVNLRKI